MICKSKIFKYTETEVLKISLNTSTICVISKFMTECLFTANIIHYVRKGHWLDSVTSIGFNEIVLANCSTMYVSKIGLNL